MAVAILAVAAVLMVTGILLLARPVVSCHRCHDPLPNGWESHSAEYGYLCRRCSRELGVPPWYVRFTPEVREAA